MICATDVGRTTITAAAIAAPLLRTALRAYQSYF